MSKTEIERLMKEVGIDESEISFIKNYLGEEVFSSLDNDENIIDFSKSIMMDLNKED